MRQQRLVFGEVAELYDRARAGYPEALIDDVISFAGGDGPSLRALEVGAGTGKATVGFASRDLEILALEPSADMAADTALMNLRLQGYIDGMPEQYYWVHKRFKTRPVGESGVY